MTSHLKAGYTLIELLVVVTLILMIVGFAISGFQNYAQFQAYEQSVGAVRGTLYQARVDARASEGGGAHGVRIQPSSIITFVGSSYNAGASTNETTTFQNVTLTPTLSGGTTDIVFDPLTGRPNATGTITITGTQHSETTTITISATGVIE